VNRSGVDDFDGWNLGNISCCTLVQFASSLLAFTLLEYCRLWAKAQ
jgi:hypothetical protein